MLRQGDETGGIVSRTPGRKVDTSQQGTLGCTIRRTCKPIIILPASKNRILYNCSCGPTIINAGTGLAAGVAWGDDSGWPGGPGW